MREAVLVTGGAGFIGSHVTRLLLEHGYDVTVVDDLSQGHRGSVPQGRLLELRLEQTGKLADLMRKTSCSAVLHFAGSALVGESMREPARYFRNNVAGSLALLTAMGEAGVKALIFSSTAAVYGNAGNLPISETDTVEPCNPYGESKAMVESMLPWFDMAHGIRSVSLRYFNAAGAHPGGALAERHEPETHLLPLLLRAAITGQPVTIHGNDYQTADGTCVRDFIHVEDLAQGHLLALEHLLAGGTSRCYNLGTGAGCTILQAIGVVEQVTSRSVPHVFGPRRSGDPACLVASPARIKHELGWSPRFPLVHSMIEHAWRARAPE